MDFSCSFDFDLLYLAFVIILSKFITKNNNFNKEFQNEISFIFGNNILHRIDSIKIINAINNLSKYIKYSSHIIYNLPGNINGDILNFNNYIKKPKSNTLYYLLGT